MSTQIRKKYKYFLFQPPTTYGVFVAVVVKGWLILPNCLPEVQVLEVFSFLPLQFTILCQFASNKLNIWALPNQLPSALTFHPNLLHLSRLLKEIFSWSSVRINIFKLHMQKDQHQLFSLTVDIVSLVKQNGCKKSCIISPHKLTKPSRQLYA